MISRIIPENSIKSLRQLIEKADKVVITCHVSPDGDAIGSSLGLAHVLKLLGKRVVVITPDAAPKSLRWLPGARDIMPYSAYEEYARKLLHEAHLIFCLDYNASSRVDRMEPALLASPATKVMIDHHKFPGDFVNLVISHPECSSTALLVFRALCRLELFDRIDRDAATCLLTGMMTDTGNLSYNASDPDLYIIVSELIKKGVDKDMIYARAINTSSEAALRLNAYALSQKMQIFHDHGCALITLDEADKQQFGYEKGDTEGLVNKPLAIPEVTWSVYLRQDPEQIKVSMRSKGSFPVDLVCRENFGGGGHLNAAGGEFKGSLQECIDRLIAAMPKYDSYLPAKQ